MVWHEKQRKAKKTQELVIDFSKAGLGKMLVCIIKDEKISQVDQYKYQVSTLVELQTLNLTGRPTQTTFTRRTKGV